MRSNGILRGKPGSAYRPLALLLALLTFLAPMGPAAASQSLYTGYTHSQFRRWSAIAGLSFQEPFSLDYSASANMLLPFQPGQRLAYSVWLMFVTYPPRGGRMSLTHLPAFVQVGLMRFQANRRETAFIAYATPGAAQVFYKDVETLDEGYHRVEMKGDASSITAMIDGRPIYVFDRRKIFRSEHAAPTLAVGAEAAIPGDRVAATVAGLRVKTDVDLMPAILEPEWVSLGYGLAFRKVGDAYVADGWFDPTAGIKWAWRKRHRR